jgi:hypothetical protein
MFGLTAKRTIYLRKDVAKDPANAALAKLNGKPIALPTDPLMLALKRNCSACRADGPAYLDTRGMKPRFALREICDRFEKTLRGRPRRDRIARGAAAGVRPRIHRQRTGHLKLDQIRAHSEIVLL